MQQIKGTLIPIGGNEDKGDQETENYTLEFIDEGILYHVVKEAGGIDAKIVTSRIQTREITSRIPNLQCSGSHQIIVISDFPIVVIPSIAI